MSQQGENSYSEPERRAQDKLQSIDTLKALIHTYMPQDVVLLSVISSTFLPF